MKKFVFSVMAASSVLVPSFSLTSCQDKDSNATDDCGRSFSVHVSIANRGYNCYLDNISQYTNDLFSNLQGKIVSMNNTNSYCSLSSIKSDALYLQRTIENMNDGTVVKISVYDDDNEVATYNLEKYNYEYNELSL